MVSGLAPGSDEETWIVGKSTWGRGATGSIGQVTSPTRRSAADRSEVPMGRLIKIAEIFTGYFFSDGRLVESMCAPPRLCGRIMFFLWRLKLGDF